LLIAIRAARSSSTIRTDLLAQLVLLLVPHDDGEAASVAPGSLELDVSANVPRQRSTDGQAHAESLASVSLIIVHLVELVEEVWDVLRGNPHAGVAHLD
jgi:hypothetical protein